MKSLKILCVAIALTLVLGLPAFAGDTMTPPCAPPAPGEILTPPCNSIVPGETICPPASDYLVAEAAISLFESLLLF